MTRARQALATATTALAAAVAGPASAQTPLGGCAEEYDGTSCTFSAAAGANDAVVHCRESSGPAERRSCDVIVNTPDQTASVWCVQAEHRHGRSALCGAWGYGGVVGGSTCGHDEDTFSGTWFAGCAANVVTSGGGGRVLCGRLAQDYPAQSVVHCGASVSGAPGSAAVACSVPDDGSAPALPPCGTNGPAPPQGGPATGPVPLP